MKPVAPALRVDERDTPVRTLQSEIRALCESRSDHERITIPAPPSPESLRLATPVPPPEPDERDTIPPSHVESSPRRDTIPSPPPSSPRRRGDDVGEDEDVPSTIPGPPRVPNIAG
jgi:hypothetical protein